MCWRIQQATCGALVYLSPHLVHPCRSYSPLLPKSYFLNYSEAIISSGEGISVFSGMKEKINL